MSERTAQTRLMRWALVKKQHIVAVTNSRYLVRGEADLLSVTRAGYVHEFEIKCSKADYLRDFKTKRYKHMQLGVASPRYAPNYYWFATFGFDDIEPPDYAGWIFIDPGDKWPYIEVMRTAPRLHKVKWECDKIAKLARKLSFRLLSEYENDLRRNGRTG